VAAGACNDPEVFFFEKVKAGEELAISVTGPAGQFSADIVFTDGNTLVETPLGKPPVKKTLPSAKDKTHLVSIILGFVAACEVKVEATVGTQKYCRKVAGAPPQTHKVTLLMRMVS
jgi:hypothetical protein